MPFWVQSLIVFSLLAISSVSSVAHCYEAELKFYGKSIESGSKSTLLPVHSDNCPTNVTTCIRYWTEGVTAKGTKVGHVLYECDKRHHCKKYGIANECKQLNDSHFHKETYDRRQTSTTELCCCMGMKCNKGEFGQKREKEGDRVKKSKSHQMEQGVNQTTSDDDLDEVFEDETTPVGKRTAEVEKKTAWPDVKKPDYETTPKEVEQKKSKKEEEEGKEMEEVTYDEEDEGSRRQKILDKKKTTTGPGEKNWPLFHGFTFYLF